MNRADLPFDIGDTTQPALTEQKGRCLGMSFNNDVMPVRFDAILIVIR
jgi:hypothetical protein